MFSLRAQTLMQDSVSQIVGSMSFQREKSLFFKNLLTLKEKHQRYKDNARIQVQKILIFFIKYKNRTLEIQTCHGKRLLTENWPEFSACLKKL